MPPDFSLGSPYHASDMRAELQRLKRQLESGMPQLVPLTARKSQRLLWSCGIVAAVMSSPRIPAAIRRLGAQVILPVRVFCAPCLALGSYYKIKREASDSLPLHFNAYLPPAGYQEHRPRNLHPANRRQETE